MAKGEIDSGDQRMNKAEWYVKAQWQAQGQRSQHGLMSDGKRKGERASRRSNKSKTKRDTKETYDFRI